MCRRRPLLIGHRIASINRPPSLRWQRLGGGRRVVQLLGEAEDAAAQGVHRVVGQVDVVEQLVLVRDVSVNATGTTPSPWASASRCGGWVRRLVGLPLVVTAPLLAGAGPRPSRVCCFLITKVSAIARLALYQPALTDAGYVTGAGSDGRILLGVVCGLILVVAVIGTAITHFLFM
jgi:hypothetical protein